MQFNVAQLLKERVGQSRSYEIEENIDVIDDAEGGSHVTGEVELLGTDRGILVRARLKTSVKCVCSRCLEVFDCPLSFEIAEVFFPTVDVNTGVSLEMPEEASPFTIDENHILDLSEAVRQYALLAMPMKLICRPDCAGLCPHCGCNLNNERCYCAAPMPDSRWAELYKLASPGGAAEKR